MPTSTFSASCGEVVKSASYLFSSANHFLEGQRLGASASAITQQGLGEAHWLFFSRSPFLTNGFAPSSTQLVNERICTECYSMNHGRMEGPCVAKPWQRGDASVEKWLQVRLVGGGMWGQKAWQGHFKPQGKEGELVLLWLGFCFPLGLQIFNSLEPQPLSSMDGSLEGAERRPLHFFTDSCCTQIHGTGTVRGAGDTQGTGRVLCLPGSGLCAGKGNGFHIKVLRSSSRRGLKPDLPLLEKEQRPKVLKLVPRQFWGSEGGRHGSQDLNGTC